MSTLSVFVTRNRLLNLFSCLHKSGISISLNKLSYYVIANRDSNTNKIANSLQAKLNYTISKKIILMTLVTNLKCRQSSNCAYKASDLTASFCFELSSVRLHAQTKLSYLADTKIYNKISSAIFSRLLSYLTDTTF